MVACRRRLAIGCDHQLGTCLVACRLDQRRRCLAASRLGARAGSAALLDFRSWPTPPLAGGASSVGLLGCRADTAGGFRLAVDDSRQPDKPWRCRAAAVPSATESARSNSTGRADGALCLAPTGPV